MEKNSSKKIADIIRDKKPNSPIFVFRENSLKKAVKFFQKNFMAKALFAVKTNPSKYVLKSLYNNGVRNFDVASIAEVRLIKQLFPDAKCYFMHPVKSRSAIKESYELGVRDFSLDSLSELHKILQETNNASDLSLHVRVAIPNSYAELALSEKFGIELDNAVDLIKKVSKYANKLGTCFHVGSQCMHPDAYRIAIRMVAGLVKEADVKIHTFNVGGGFPSIYPGMIPPDIEDYFEAIHEEFSKIQDSENIELLSEPGRALVAESLSVIVKVEMKKKDKLYINDGTYGSLFDAGYPGFIFPVKLIRDVADKNQIMPFSFYGPTCDSLDFMKGPFYLPNDINEGDYIEIGQIGAYGRTMATKFNGFTADKIVYRVSDEPLMTMYDDEKYTEEKFEVIAA